ncbi:hypothetical protein SAMN05421820_106400 [Pedobacter steynii]|uniref:Uncharacterized protein n=1 Tax=Pedobacter steynii TaxID=430522 RepID=A0A1G9ZCB2_9SPHI|nr:hypothetical protein SAMN05421820_106400 [Pedobacter steynii]
MNRFQDVMNNFCSLSVVLLIRFSLFNVVDVKAKGLLVADVSNSP